MSAIDSFACPTQLTIDRCEDMQAASVDAFQILQNPVDTLPGVVGNLEQVTCVRLVGELVLHGFHDNPNASTITVSSLQCSLGIYQADADLGGSIVPKDPAHPADSESGDWMWHSFVDLSAAVRSTASAAEGTPKAQLVTEQLHIDIKVKRKVKKEEGIFLVLHTAHGELLGSAINVDAWLSGYVRAYVLLP